MSKFKAGDKVVALKGFHTIKIGDILTVEASDEYWFQAAECRGYSLYVANYELYKPQFKNMKFRVFSSEHSKEIQEALFEMGYVWSGESKPKLDSTNFSFLYTKDSRIKYGMSLDSFEKDIREEYTIETTKSYKLIPVVTKVTAETVTIDGKTYDKEAVLKRLAELEEVK